MNPDESLYRTKINELLITASHLKNRYPIYKNITKSHIRSLDQYKIFPYMNREDFFSFPIPENVTFVMKSRVDHLGRSPQIPLSSNDLRQLVNFEAYKLSLCGMRKGDRTTIVGIPLDHTIPISLAFMQLNTSFFCLDGTNNVVLHSIISQKISVLFTTIHFVEELIAYVKNNHLKTSLKYVLTAGATISDLQQFSDKVKKYLGAQLIDNIGSRELAGYAISCPKHHVYHFLDSYQYVEIVNPKSNQHSKSGEIVITPFWRKDLPLIRYKTGDFINLEKRKKCSCLIGGNEVFKGIIKRIDNTIKIGAESFLSIDKLYDVVGNALYYQYPFDRILWGIVTKPEFLLVISTVQDHYTLYLFIDKPSFLFSLRTKRRLTQLASNPYGISPTVYFVDKNDILSLKNIQRKYDLRYMKKRAVPRILIKFLKKYNINAF